jgi:hypothetical protein
MTEYRTTHPTEQGVTDTDLDLEKTTGKDAAHRKSVELGRGKYSDSATELNIDGSLATLTPSVDWFYGIPVLYIYDALQEEPAFVIALPTPEDPKARLVGWREWSDGDWFDQHWPSRNTPNHSRTHER